MWDRNGRPLSGELRYPGHGLPEHPLGAPRPPAPTSDEDIAIWARLAKGQPLGKRLNLLADRSLPGVDQPPTNLFRLAGPDSEALQLSICISPPRFFRGNVTQAMRDNLQNQSGTVDNVQDLAAGTTGSGVWNNLLAKIEWGIGGVQQVAEVDMLNGLTVNVCASFVQIGAFLEQADAFTSSTFYEVSAFVGPGRPKDLSAQRTINTPLLANIGDLSPVFAVPRFAKRCYLAGCVPTGDVYQGTLQFFRDQIAGNEVAEYLFTGNQPFMAPVPNGAFFARVKAGLADSQNQAVFELGI